MGESGPDPISAGRHAQRLLQRHSQRLITLGGAVLLDRDPEPLHQMRVTLRRLSTVLHQFGPALELPEAVSPRRLAKTVRRLGQARDLDVLIERLEQQLLPALPKAEARQLKPVLKRLRRRRRHSHGHLHGVLRGDGYRATVRALEAWLAAPQLTPLGQEPLADWLLEWHWPWIGSLLLHPAWRLQTPEGRGNVRQLHDLRKGIKEARYRLENLEGLAVPGVGMGVGGAVKQLKQGQEWLGELHDLAVLRSEISAVLHKGAAGTHLGAHLAQLELTLRDQERQAWQSWRLTAAALTALPGRRALVTSLLAAPEADETSAKGADAHVRPA